MTCKWLMKSMDQEKLSIAFIHPDMGIGGAEQLIVNLALALQQKGHYTKIYTPYHDINHCFKETIDGTIEVEKRGNIIPRNIFGKLTALCVYIQVYLKSFKILSKFQSKTPEILYPSIDISKFQTLPTKENLNYFVSLNRYERKKNINLALEAFSEFLKISDSKDWRLIIAGGFEENHRENTEHYKELLLLADKLGLNSKIDFKKNIDNSERIFLLSQAQAVLYTPSREHFGIVPVEGINKHKILLCQAMYLQTPVIAVNDGGPLESVSDGKTGFLIEQNAKKWAEKMKLISQDNSLQRRMGREGKQRVLDMFSFEAFTNQTNSLILRCMNKKSIKSD